MAVKRLGRKDYLHCRAVRATVYKAHTETKIKRQLGYKLYLWCKTHLDTLDYSILNFWVVKKDCAKYKRGAKIMKRKEMEEFLKLGGRVREILTYKRATRKALKELIEVFDLPVAGQHGFVTGHNVFNVAEDVIDELKVNPLCSFACLDLEDAFHQITQDQIYGLLRFIYDLNDKHALKFAEIMCNKGHLFQGNTLAPLLFNLWSSRLVNLLSICKIRVSQYADDLTIISRYKYVTRRILRFIYKLIAQLGFKANLSKTQLYKRKRIELLGLRFKYDPNYKVYGMFARSHRKFRKNMRLWFYLTSKGLKTTRRINKEGNPITLKEMRKGLWNWLSTVRTESKRLGLK